MNKIIRNRTIIFAISLSFLTLLFLIITYSLLMKEYEAIEDVQNIKKINNLISNFEKELDKNQKITNLLTVSNEIYECVIENRKININQQFLSRVDVDFIIFQKENKSYFSIEKTKHSIKNIEKLKSFIIKKYTNSKSLNTIIFFNNELFTISKELIVANNFQAKKKNFLYVIRKLRKNIIDTMGSDFMNIYIYNKPTFSLNKSIDLASQNFSKIKFFSSKNSDKMINRVLFFDSYNLNFAVKTVDNRLLILEAKNTIFVFAFALFVFLLILFYVSYVYQRGIKKYNDKLEEKVEHRTMQIKSTLKELEKANLRLYDMAHTDFLTKTMNRRNFFLHAKEEFSKALEEKTSLCSIMIDIDNFKKLNDTYGHDLGDNVLKEFSTCVKRSLKDNKIFGRLGGEEFAILLKSTSLKQAIEIAENIRKNLEKTKLEFEDNTIQITASFGVSDKTNCNNIDEMLQKADKHLYKAKNQGKNKVRSRLS